MGFRSVSRTVWLCRAVLALVAISATWPTSHVALAADALGGQAPRDFARDVRPIFEKHCFTCHGPERQESEFRLDRREDALRGGTGGRRLCPARVAKARSSSELRVPTPIWHASQGEPLVGEAIDAIRAGSRPAPPGPPIRRQSPDQQVTIGR